MKKLTKITALFLTITLMLSACSGSSGKSDKSTNPAGQRIGVVMANLTNANYILMADEFKRYGEELGYEVLITDTNDDTTKAVTAAENYATMGVDALVFSPMDTDVATSATEAAKNINPDLPCVIAAIEVEAMDFGVIQSDEDAGYILGIEAGKWINENMEGSAQVGLIAIWGGTLIIRTQAFQRGVQDTVTGNVEFIEQTFDRSGGRTGYEIMEDWLQGYPELKVIFGAADSMCLGSYEALKAAGLNEDEYAIYGVDGTQNAIAALKEGGAFRGTADSGATATPLAIIDVVAALLQGTDPESMSVTIPPKVVNQSNVDGWAYDYNWVEIKK